MKRNQDVKRGTILEFTPKARRANKDLDNIKLIWLTNHNAMIFNVNGEIIQFEMHKTIDSFVKISKNQILPNLYAYSVPNKTLPFIYPKDITNGTFEDENITDLITEFNIEIRKTDSHDMIYIDERDVYNTITLLMEKSDVLFDNEFKKNITNLIKTDKFDMMNLDNFNICYSTIMEYIGEEISNILKS